VHHIWCPLSSQEYQDLPDGAETTLTDILTKDIVREIRKTVKSPQDQLQVYRINDQIITLEMMEK
ncbi:hypothetical protein PO345_27090, partial [Klebsiella pneumoniae]